MDTVHRATHSPWQGIWRVADPKITLASMSSLLLGLAAAGHDGPIAWGWAALTVLGIFFIEAGKNASGEIFDWDSGVDKAVAERDRSPFSGGKRVLVDGLLTRPETAFLAGVFYGLTAAVGLSIVLFREPHVLWLGVVGAALAYFYHAPPIALSYRGLGELAVAIAYGPLIASGAYLVQRGAVTPEVVSVTVPLALLVSAFLVINEFPDRDADESAGKRTLVVRLGKRRAATGFAVLVSSAFAMLLLLPLLGAPVTVLLGVLGAPLALRAARLLRASYDDTRQILPAQVWTLLSFCLYAVGTSAGLLLDRLLGT